MEEIEISMPCCISPFGEVGAVCGRKFGFETLYFSAKGPESVILRLGAIQKSTSNKCWRGVEKREPSYTVGGNAN